jgi:hypothetical protein
MILRAALVGFVVMLLLEVTAAVTLMLVANSSGWGDVHLAIGPLEFLDIHTGASAVSISIGNGITVAAILGGALNAAGAYWLRRAER